MSLTPSEDYIAATKLIESFSCFFEKINNASLDTALNAQKLVQLKKILYSNITSPEDIISASTGLCGKALENPQSPIKAVSMLSTPRSDESQQFEPVSNYTAPREFSSVQPSQICHQVNQENLAEEQRQLDTEYLPATSFLALIRAACHNDMSKLFSLSSSYAHIRTFNGRYQSVFNALCFAFLERIIKEKGRDSQFYLTQGHHQKKSREDPTIAKEAEFLQFFKNYCQYPGDSDMTRKFYETVSANSEFYQSALSIFRQHIIRVVLDNRMPQDESFEWMNDLDEVEDTSFFQGLTKVFQSNLKFLVLTRVKLVERIFYYEKLDSLNGSVSHVTLTIFFDKTSKTSFILYPLGKPTEEEPATAYPRHRAVPSLNTSFNMKPTGSNPDSLKSLKNIGHENGSLTTLDTINTPMTSLNEIEHKGKAGPATKPLQLKKANTLNIFTNSLNDCSSPTFVYPESALTRPTTEKINYTGFHSASKDLGYNRMRTEEDLLVRKNREPAPPRPSNYYLKAEGPMSEERTFGKVVERYERLEFSRPQMETLLEESRVLNDSTERSTYFERSPKKESISLRAYMSETRTRNDEYPSRSGSIEPFSLGKFKLNDTVVTTVRPAGLPILLKSKMDRFNHTLNQNDQEIANTVAKHVKNDVRDKGTELISIMSTYQAIMGQTQESRDRPMTMLRMDR